jgi:hypothetical protein
VAETLRFTRQISQKSKTGISFALNLRGKEPTVMQLLEKYVLRQDQSTLSCAGGYMPAKKKTSVKQLQDCETRQSAL